MSVARRNVLANIAGKGWAALISLAFVPIYIRFLGIEAFGLIGFFLSLYAIMSLFDLGLGTTLNRELAKMSSQSRAGREMRDLLRTLEIAYWLIGILIGLIIAALAPAIAAHWIKAQQLSQHTVEQALLLMGIALACQWPIALYTGGLMGLQRQVLQNALSATMITVRSAGAALVLWQVSATIEAFLVWQLASSLAETLINAIALWRSLPAETAPPRFRFQLVLGVWRFAAGVTGISALAVILTQLDKVILSSVLSLEMFGYYSLASRVAGALYYLINPVIATFFPRFSQLFALGDEQELRRLYHRGCQLMSVLILPPAVVLMLFSHELLLLWTQDRSIAENSYLVLSLLVAGNTLNALLSLPGALQLAYGWTRLLLVINTASVLLFAPLIYFMSLYYGGVGAAMVWILLNAGYMLVNQNLMHRRLLRGELWRWYRLDIGQPLVVTVAVAGVWKWLIPHTETVWSSLLNLILVSAVTLVAAIIAAPEIRILATRWLTPAPHAAK
jgi:O-antigen/teichoic acid export membrane protein